MAATGQAHFSKAAIDALNQIKNGVYDIQRGGQAVVNAHEAVHNPTNWTASDTAAFLTEYEDLLSKVKALLPPLDGIITACESGVNENTTQLQLAGEL